MTTLRMNAISGLSDSKPSQDIRLAVRTKGHSQSSAFHTASRVRKPQTGRLSIMQIWRSLLFMKTDIYTTVLSDF